MYMYLYVVVRPYATDNNQHYNRNVGLGSPNYISTCVMVSAWQMYMHNNFYTLAIMVHLKRTMYIISAILVVKNVLVLYIHACM